MQRHAERTTARAAIERAAPALEPDEIDVCVRGDPGLQDASWVPNLDPEDVLPRGDAAETPAAKDAPGDPARDLPDAALVAHVVERHHAYVRRALPYVVALLDRAAGLHGRRDGGRLTALGEAGQELAELLEGHLEEEERRLFPALVAAGAGEGARRERDEMRRHHRDVARLLDRIRFLASDYAAPDWSDRGHRALLEELEALDEDLEAHVRLEARLLATRSPSPYVGPF